MLLVRMGQGTWPLLTTYSYFLRANKKPAFSKVGMTLICSHFSVSRVLAGFRFSHLGH